MQTIHTKAGFKVLRESLGLYQSDVAEAAGVDVKTVKNWESPRLPRARATAVAWKYLENLAEIQEREVGCLVEKIVDETDGNPYPLPYFREQDLAAEDARAARISNAMTRKVAFELTRLAIPYEFHVWQAQVTLCRHFAARPGEKHGRRGFHRLRRTRGHRRARRKAPRARR